MGVGLCVPNMCGDETIKKLLGYVVPFMNNLAMPIEFEGVDGVKAIEKGQGLLVDELVLEDSFSLNKDATDFRFGNFLALFMMSPMCCLPVAATIIHWFKEKEKSKTAEKAKKEEEAPDSGAQGAEAQESENLDPN